MVKYFLLIGVYLFTLFQLSGQARTKLSLSEAYELLEDRYPILQNAGLLDAIHQKELDQLKKSRQPVLLLKADGRLQTESVSLDVDENTPLPFEIDQPLYSLRGYLEAQYTILDGGMNNAQKSLKEAQLKADQQSLEVDRYALRERVNQLFICIIMLREQEKMFDLSLEDLKARKERVTAGVEHGTVLESELSKIEVKELQLKAQQDNLAFKQTGLINTLNQLLGIELAENVSFNFPTLTSAGMIPNLNRPEQKLFRVQREAILANSLLIEASRRPRLGAFAQGGVGYPNPLNILDNSTAPFGVIGLQFSWKIAGGKSTQLDKEVLALQAQKLQQAEETFEFNMTSKESTYLAEVERLQAQIEQDGEIAKLQAGILLQMAAQLDEGVITSSDYISQVNAELSARQNLLIHQTELLKTQIEFWNDRGGK